MLKDLCKETKFVMVGENNWYCAICTPGLMRYHQPFFMQLDIYLILSELVKNFNELLNTMKNALDDVVAGNLNVNIDTTNLTEDEVDSLIIGVVDLIGIIKDIITDLSEIHIQYMKVGNLHYNIDDSKYQNSFKEMVGHINNLLTSVTTDIKEISDTMNQMSDGNFDKNIDFDAWAGDWKIIPR